MTIHPDLLLAEKLIYRPCGLTINNVKVENESAEYGACGFTIEKSSIKFRVGKITPTKVGQFVTFWKRIDNGPILPYDATDSFDFLVVNVRAEKHFGQFVFPKTVLLEKHIISSSKKEGKRAMRIYPSWDKAENAQAKKTQSWQLNYFMEFSEKNFDVARIKNLFSIC